MSDVGCRMANGEWRMANGECRMPDAGCRMQFDTVLASPRKGPAVKTARPHNRYIGQHE
jgi:hypothetical protein